jgi:hypothetical protein
MASVALLWPLLHCYGLCCTAMASVALLCTPLHKLPAVNKNSYTEFCGNPSNGLFAYRTDRGRRNRRKEMFSK